MNERRGNAIALGILALVPSLLFADVLFGVRAFFARDVLHYYYPAKKVLREIVLRGDFPYWNPFFNAGQPLAANPEHEVFYPLTWLILLPDYIYALQLLPLLHILIATFAMYALLRSMELRRVAACIGALSFGIGGLLCSMLILFPYLLSIAWLPLTCLFARRYLLRRTPRDLILSAFFLGLQLLVGEPTTALQSGVILGLYALYRGVRDERSMLGMARRVGAIGAISGVALLVAAVQVIPTVDHLGDTARAQGIEWENASRWSMPLQRLGELVHPTLLGRDAAIHHDHYWGGALYGETRVPFYFGIYSGLLLTVAAIAGLFARSRGTWLVLSMIALSAIAAAGAHTPLLRILYDAGIANTLRYPEKYVLILVFTIVVFGAQTVDRILRGDDRLRRVAMRVTFTITFIAGAVALFSLTGSHEQLFRRLGSIDPAREIDELLVLARRGWVLLAARATLLLLLFAGLRRIRRPLWIALAGLFVLADLAPLTYELAPRVPMAFYRDAPAALQQFPRERDNYRLFHIANWSGRSRSGTVYNASRPEHYWLRRNALSPLIPAAHGLHVALSGDFDLTDLVPTEEFTTAVWELEKYPSSDWINVAASMSNVRYLGIYRRPEEAIAQAKGDWRAVQPVKFVAGPRNPRYYFAGEMEIARDRAEFVRKLAAKRYRRDVAFVSGEAFPPARGVVRRVREWTNGARLDVEAAGRSFLIASVTPHKYWDITIDGVPATPVVTNLGYQGVVVPAGRHVVEMRYRNPLILTGGAISLATLLALAIAFCRMRGL